MKPLINDTYPFKGFWLYTPHTQHRMNAWLHHRCVPLDRQRVLCVPLFHINKTHFKKKILFFNSLYIYVVYTTYRVCAFNVLYIHKHILLFLFSSLFDYDTTMCVAKKQRENANNTRYVTKREELKTIFVYNVCLWRSKCELEKCLC